MGRLVWILLIVSVAVGLSLLLQFNHGNVAVLWPPYRVDVRAPRTAARRRLTSPPPGALL